MYKWHWDPNYRKVHRHNDQSRIRLESAAKNLQLPTVLVRGGLSDVLSEEGALCVFKWFETDGLIF